MAKAKKGKEALSLEIKAGEFPAEGMPDTLSDVRYEYEGAAQVGVDEEMVNILVDVRSMDSVLTSYAGRLDASEGVLVHSFYKAIEGVGKAGQATIRDRLLEVGTAEGGKVETAYGSLAVSEVSSSVVKHYTDKTMELLEDKKLLPRAVEMQAAMKTGINVEMVSDDEMTILKKYFDIILNLNADKVNGLVALGEVSAMDIEATCEEQTVRSGSVRLLVKTATALAAKFGMGKTMEVK